MKKLGFLRLFSCLPLIAIIIPDTTETFINPDFKIPFIHVVFDAAFIAIIGICTLIIRRQKKQDLKIQYQRS
ncbi:hypothetical protein SAMN05192574_103502 [Mucilaginibacter gossypiicola]|uniref:Uncharacterized protein n=1 Tax=Mucilaginibacter gossypiicola TaxID=551995 RepID=A0A1H8HGI5_9SPHI|nr:hypothetical protein [Mucilaginibacter gossypiicola]SEN55342.1 hypothetical protein SAMN05192574_103502 [Mucilaginibacter gossypiicola]